VDQRNSELLRELRYAMDEAFGKSARVIAAIVALQHAGQRVRIAIDTSLVGARVPPAPSPFSDAHSDSKGVLMLDANDMLFLRDLRISVELA
jgi:hypothetical protein